MDQGAGQERAGLPLGWEPRGRLLDGLLGRTSGPMQCLPAASSITAVSQRGMRLLTASTGLINRSPRARCRGTPPGESLAPMGCPPTTWVGPDLSSGVPKTHPVTPETRNCPAVAYKDEAEQRAEQSTQPLQAAVLPSLGCPILSGWPAARVEKGSASFGGQEGRDGTPAPCLCHLHPVSDGAQLSFW